MKPANGLKNKCYGRCNEHLTGCDAEEIVHVKVFGHGQVDPWEFNYCKDAINTDRKNGFTVEIVGEWFKAEKR